MPIQRTEEKFALGPNLKILAFPIVALLVLIVLAVVLSQFALSKISSQNEEIAKTQKEENILSAKLIFLSEVESQIGSQAEALTFYLPDEHPALSIIAQIKSLASPYNLAVENIRVGTEAKEGSVSKVSVDFDVDGQTSAILTYLKALKSAMPIMTFSRIKIAGVTEVVRASITLNGFWSPLLTKIPAITEPVEELTPDEKSLIEQITGFTKLPFGKVAPSSPAARGNPFE
jgi:Tfp pilus assembly protein PilO